MRLYRQLLRWAFARFYREFAWTYDAVAALVSRGLWQHWIVAVVPYLRGPRVLELGSGTGYLQRALLLQGFDAVALDASPFMLRLARRKLAQAGLRGVLLHGYAQALPFASERFTDVVATFPSEYILDPRTLAEIQRVLAPDGQFLMLDAAQLTDADAYSAAVEAAYRVTQQVRHDDPRPRLLAAAGFEHQAAWIPVGRSRVQLLIGQKRAEDGANTDA